MNTENPNMSQTVIHGDTVYLSGQVPADYSGDIKQQTEETLAKIDALLEVRENRSACPAAQGLAGPC